MNLHIGKFLDRYVGIPLCGLLYLFVHAGEILFGRNRQIHVKNILLVKLWGVGNLVLLLPAIEAIRRKHPDARISFLTLKPNCGILEGHPFINRIIPLSTSSLPLFFLSSLLALFSARRHKINLLLDFEQFCRFSSLFSLLSGAKQRIGFHNPRQARGFLYTVQIPYKNNKHMKDSFFEIARAAGAEKVEDHWPPSLAYLLNKVKDLDAVKKAEEAGKILVGIHAGSGDNFIGRRWPLDSFTALSKILMERFNSFIVFTGTKKEKALVGQITANLQGSWMDATGSFSLAELAKFVSCCRLFLSNDTAPVHFASALGTPLIAFYGPNTPTLYGPLHKEGIAFYNKFPCSPCLTNLNAKTSFCRIPLCIQEIKVEAVAKAVEEILEKGAPGKAKKEELKAGDPVNE